MNKTNKTLLGASVLAILASSPLSAQNNPFKTTQLVQGYGNQEIKLVSSGKHHKNSESTCGASHSKMNDGKCGGAIKMDKNKKSNMQKQNNDSKDASNEIDKTE